MREKGVGKENESSLPLEMERRCYQFITFLGSRVRSLFGEPLQFTLGIPRKNSSYLHTKKRPLWLQVSFFTRFNQPVTINNIAAVTLLKKKKKIPHIRVIPGRTSVRSGSVFLFLETKEEFAKAIKKKKNGGE